MLFYPLRVSFYVLVATTAFAAAYAQDEVGVQTLPPGVPQLEQLEPEPTLTLDATLSIEDELLDNETDIDTTPAQPTPQKAPSAVSIKDGQTLGRAASSTEEEKYGWEGSLMFDDERMNNLLKIYRAYQNKKRVDAPVTADVKEDGLQLPVLMQNASGEEPIPEEVLKFSLNSIVYDTVSKWSVWINGQKYNQKQATEGFSIDRSNLKVVDANRQSVTFLWEPIEQSFPQVRQRWEEKQTLSALGKNTQEAQNERVVFDDTARTVVITLRPNQTFVSQFMTVMEGVDTIRPMKQSVSEDNIPIPEMEDDQIINPPQ
ncbi:MAG: hypothetical protein MK052_00580 [Alphaproteobacteria bacterium]|nr:hypothetical protein [Alphaproteobacteria bacterium]